jgi:hypothetical protein
MFHLGKRCIDVDRLPVISIASQNLVPQTNCKSRLRGIAVRAPMANDESNGHRLDLEFCSSEEAY